MRSLVRNSFLELSALGFLLAAAWIAAKLGLVSTSWDPALGALIIFALWLAVCALIYRAIFRIR